jgi:hypothetical protein
MSTITNVAAFVDGWIARELEDWDGRAKEDIFSSLTALRRAIRPHLFSGEWQSGELRAALAGLYECVTKYSTVPDQDYHHVTTAAAAIANDERFRPAVDREAFDRAHGLRPEPYPPFEGTDVMSGDENRP